MGAMLKGQDSNEITLNSFKELGKMHLKKAGNSSWAAYFLSPLKFDKYQQSFQGELTDAEAKFWLNRYHDIYGRDFKGFNMTRCIIKTVRKVNKGNNDKQNDFVSNLIRLNTSSSNATLSGEYSRQPAASIVAAGRLRTDSNANHERKP
jgi:hypothetical protein